jgi:hypothetical protein
VPPPAPPAPAAVAEPAPLPYQRIDAGAVKKAMSWMQPEIAGCFQRGLERNRDLGGTVYARFTIEVDRQEGRVIAPAVDPDNTTLADGAVQQCIVAELSRAQFPVPGVDRGRVRVRYPFTMRRTAQTPF